MGVVVAAATTAVAAAALLAAMAMGRNLAMGCTALTAEPPPSGMRFLNG
jgi:hypothetical protein